MGDKQPVQVSFTSEFQKAVKKLRKKYPQIQQDIQPLLDLLLHGETPGDQIQSIGNTVYKVRVANRDAKRGKSGGYRVIYYIHTSTQIILLTIYSKSDRADMPSQVIQELIAGLPENGDDEHGD